MQFTETVTVQGVTLLTVANVPAAPGEDATIQSVQVTLQQPNGSTFTIVDQIANAAKYTVGATLTLTLG
jgi:hypothetical protein